MANGDNGLPRYGWGHVVVGREEVEEEIVDKFVLTFSNGDYDNRFDEALSLDRSIIQPVRPTQASYHKPDNWQDRNRIGLERIKGQLQGLFNEVSQDKHCFSLA